MLIRFLFALLIVATLSAPSAAQGNGNGASKGNADAGSGGQGNPDHASDARPGGNQPEEGGASPAGNKNAGNSANHGESPLVHMGSTRSVDVRSLSPDDALAMVQTHQALPLSDLAAIVRQRSGAEMIDAELLMAGEMLVYAIKVIDSAQRLSIQYYYARSGHYIGSE